MKITTATAENADCAKPKQYLTTIATVSVLVVALDAPSVKNNESH